ncbi:helix-turn-helix domain-containing protein [Streptomyces sp. S465]|uniref:helix-turn-helix domain-containing protein n=1 Tax=Streptomyces sp. S465 TaxID=2979468 RepID=UPI003FCEC906
MALGLVMVMDGVFLPGPGTASPAALSSGRWPASRHHDRILWWLTPVLDADNVKETAPSRRAPRRPCGRGDAEACRVCTRRVAVRGAGKGSPMGLAERRKALGYSQEGLAHVVGVDRTTISRWESGKTEIQPQLRPQYAAALQLDLAELDAWVTKPQATFQEPVVSCSVDHYGSGDTDDTQVPARTCRCRGTGRSAGRGVGGARGRSAPPSVRRLHPDEQPPLAGVSTRPCQRGRAPHRLRTARCPRQSPGRTLRQGRASSVRRCGGPLPACR